MAVKRVRVVHMVLNSLAVPSGFVGFLTATEDHTSASPTNTQKSSTSLGWGARSVGQGLCPSTISKVHHE